MQMLNLLLLAQYDVQVVENASLKIWAFSDVHQQTNVGKLTTAISDMSDKDWDIAIDLGDCVQPGTEGDAPFQAYLSEHTGMPSAKSVNDVYHIMGNSDATVKDDPAGANFHWQKYCDPFALNTASSGVTSRPYTPTGS